jgi:hypothetical protein
MAYLDEVTNTVYDGNFKIKDGKKTRLRTTYKVFVEINKIKYKTLCNSEDKKCCMLEIIKALSYNAYKLEGFDYDNSNINITIKEHIKDEPYAEIDFILVK